MGVTKPIRVLLIEDNPVDVRLMQADFRKFGSGEFDLTAVEHLSEAIRFLNNNSIDVILLDLFLQDAAGLETLSRVRKAAPEVPVVVLTGLDDEAQALQAMKTGAQDYLIKGNINSRVLFRVIRYAIERKQGEIERRVLEQRLMQGEKLAAVGTLAAGVAHNFNNALMVVLGHSNFLLEQMKGDDRNKLHVEGIKKASERAALLTRQLLLFSRKQAPESAILSLNKLVLDMQMLLESTLGEGIEFELKLAPELAQIKGDPSQIGQVVMNLVMNAAGAMKDSGKLTIETANGANREVVLRVSDTGCGMSPEVCAHIFDPFFTTKGLAVASGLGLSTVYGIVQQHGGNIEVSSKPDFGSTFLVTLPAFGSAKPDSSNDSNATILVVADEENSLRTHLDTIAETTQYTVLKADNWPEAVEMGRAHGRPIALLIADALTPGVMRQHLLKQLAGQHPEMAIIYISGPEARRMAANGVIPEGTHLAQAKLTPEGLLRHVKGALKKR
ncbi:MAG TPA: response regulator [Terriglobia bacterium]|nr:response regulator [Terriglobia bacterium]